MVDYFYILSGVKYYNISHLYNEQLYKNREFMVGGITHDNKLLISHIRNGNKLNTYYLSIFSILNKELKLNYRYIDIVNLDLILLSSSKYTIFINILYNNKGYAYQINFDKNRLVSYDKIDKLYNTNKTYLGLSILNKISYFESFKNNELVYTNKKISGILYVDTKEYGKISNKYIKRIKLFMNDDEKSELVSKKFITSFSEYPIIDNYSIQDEIISILPVKIKDYSVDFSSGLIKMTFED